MKATVIALLAACGGLIAAAPIETSVFANLHWRLIGPFRAGRVTAVAGIPGDSGVYYVGTPGGGVWKTTDAGRVWKPIFDSENVASIGALAIAPSDPRLIYAGTGEQTPGDGLYKSTDAGATWTNIGLSETHFIQAIVVDPHDPNILVVGTGGDVKANANRGVYRTADGGKTWTKTLFRDDTTGVTDLCADPDDPRTLYATLMRRVAGPTSSTEGAFSGIYKSSDEGASWQELKSSGLPGKERGRIGIAVASGKHDRVVYAIMAQGFFRSDDAGASWHQSTTDPRIIGNTYFSRIFIDPTNADIIYVPQTSLYRSTDGGRTFEAFRGAPGGDDYHVLWIDPSNSQRMLLGVDQGAIVSVDGGHTWSSWFNQPTGQFYHVSTGNGFPYHVYGTQQDSGTVDIVSRSDYGQILNSDWFPVGGFENGFLAEDPTNPDVVYSQAWYGGVVRFDKRTRQVANVFVRSPKYRAADAAPLMFSPQDPHTLFFATQYLLATKDAGVTWTEVSPDLAPALKQSTPQERSIGDPNGAARGGTITALSPSLRTVDVIWAGTSNRFVQVTRDGGKTWQNVTPPGLPNTGRIGSIEAGHYDTATAYIVHRGTSWSPGAFQAYVARTHDFGKTWQTITAGLPPDKPVQVVREDAVVKGLLFAGTQIGVYVSFDDGDHWQSLQLNLPTATVTDLAIHANDLVASTFGRALWILDDLTPLRELAAHPNIESVRFFQPEDAVRARWDNWPDTPFPPETPAGENPPNGAILNYYLASASPGPFTMTISDQSGRVVRRFSSDPDQPKLLPPNVPEYWFASPAALPNKAGVNRFVWDLRYDAPETLPYGYFGQPQEYTEYTLPNDAVLGKTPRRQPQGPLALPGTYKVELTVEGQKYTRPLTVMMDPRISASNQDLEAQLALAQRIASGMQSTYTLFNEVASARGEMKDAAVSKQLTSIQNGAGEKRGLGPLNRDLTRIFEDVTGGDARPSSSAVAAVDDACKDLDARIAELRSLHLKTATTQGCQAH
jgi:photosystem II stability/assembly factor-like uncharacterized protein